MPAKKVPLQWERFASQSQGLRKRLAELLALAQQIAQDEKGDVLNAHIVISRESSEWKALADRVVPEMSKVAIGMQPLRDRFVEEFSDRLKRLLTGAGLNVYGESTVLVVDGVVYVELDNRDAKVRINGISQRDLSLESLSEAVTSERKRITQARAHADTFCMQLRRAYESALSLAGGQFGAQIMTLDLLPHVLLQRQDAKFMSDTSAKHFKEYPLAQFRADLFALLDSGKLDAGDAVFHWAAGSNTKGAVFMFVPSMGRTAHVGRVWFERQGAPA